jgi:hypothetical protein
MEPLTLKVVGRGTKKKKVKQSDKVLSDNEDDDEEQGNRNCKWIVNVSEG